jgi:predicted methyltransferase
LHRVSETVVSKLAQEAGLSVLRTSDLLKNPDDPLDVGVFSPTIRGKTSQFVVLFQK